MVAEGIIWMNDHNDDDPQAIPSSLTALVFIKSKVVVVVVGGGADLRGALCSADVSEKHPPPGCQSRGRR